MQSRAALKRELILCLRTGRALRVPRSRSRQQAWAHVTPDVVISERPVEVEDRAVPGHWEGDLLIGLQRSAIGTLVDKATALMALELPRTRGQLSGRPRRAPWARGPPPHPSARPGLAVLSIGKLASGQENYYLSVVADGVEDYFP